MSSLLRTIVRTGNLQWRAALSTTSAKYGEDISKATTHKEAPIVDADVILHADEHREKAKLSGLISIPVEKDISPISGVPSEHIRSRRVRIYIPAKNAMQSGTNNVNNWEMEFDTRERWENPLMGWTSTGDPLSNMKVEFNSKEEAIVHCEKNGWSWYIDGEEKPSKKRNKNYGVNFAPVASSVFSTQLSLSDNNNKGINNRLTIKSTMVFTTIVSLVRSRGPDEFWRKRKIFKISAHFLGRRRNIYSVAVRNVHRALAYATKGRKLKKDDMQELWDTRIAGACTQFGITREAFRESLLKSDVLLNRKVLADLAIWEPKTFEAIVNTCRQRAVLDGIPGINEIHTDNKFVNTTGDKV
ncbi:NADH dehydrogenase [ubiquinone] iron-sulfur protein 4, mitochondrial [Pseudolycoriella hygida]|uniref:Large ribosomal subunit protein bL20m n=1 Tax=Pseudolycoriella hygida TaxID=35572 RepID=A0A9Q0MSK2_9DIPT|nr:NADH dehydrogenase [ubiquinone] iron-sulfur protein 4, mitochondrial [Pseudolycoriella hygida]